MTGDPVVSISECAAYEPELVAGALAEALAALGGMRSFVKPGQRVLLKVNLLAKAVPERAVTTHPELVRALIAEVRGAGGEPFVGDSPGGRNTPAVAGRILEESGIAAVCAETGVPYGVFDADTVRVDNPGGELFGAFTLGREVVEADVVISVPKLKTHGFMMLTGAVKNLFGCIPGLEKAQFHLRVPERDKFASMLIDLMLSVRPSLSVMDAVVGMEGQGPAGGSPKRIGALLASADPVALDVVAACIAGLDPMEVYTNAEAARRGIGPAGIGDVKVVGTDWHAIAPSAFELPPRDVSRKLPAWLFGGAKTAALARPHLAQAHKCSQCRRCEQECPVSAIEVSAAGPSFDYDRCIRCYCCQELCPPQAIGLKTPLIARVLATGRGKAHRMHPAP